MVRILAGYPQFVKGTANYYESLIYNCPYSKGCYFTHNRMLPIVQSFRKGAAILTEENSRREERMDALLIKLERCLK